MTIKVDLLPTEKKRFGIDPVMIFLVLVIILFTAGFFVYGKSLENQIAKRQEEVTAIDTKINEVRSKLPGIAKMKEENAKLEQQIATIKGLKNDPVRYANLLWELSEVLPANVYVSSINIEPAQQSVVLNGSALQIGTYRPLESIAIMMRSLQTSRYFRDATLAATTQSKTEKGLAYTFQIETHYDQDAALKAPDQIAPPAASPAPGTEPAPGAAPPGAAPPGAAPAPEAPGASPAAPEAPGASPAAPEASPAPSGSPAPGAEKSGALPMDGKVGDLR